MCTSARTADVLADYIAVLDRGGDGNRPRGEWGRRMMERRLRAYFAWKACLATDAGPGVRFANPGPGSQHTASKSSSIAKPTTNTLSAALAKKDAMRKERTMSRRRVRGGAPGGSSTAGPRMPETRESQTGTTVQESGMSAKEREKLGILTGESEMRVEADSLAELCVFFLCLPV